MFRLIPCPAKFTRPVAAVLLAGLIGAGAATPALANGGLPADFPALSSEPALAQRQAVGCSVVGLGLTGLVLASGVASTGGGAAVAGPVVGELLAYFGAGCTMGAFIATAFPMGQGTAEPTAPAKTPSTGMSDQWRRLWVEAAELTP